MVSSYKEIDRQLPIQTLNPISKQYDFQRNQSEANKTMPVFPIDSSKESQATRSDCQNSHQHSRVKLRKNSSYVQELFRSLQVTQKEWNKTQASKFNRNDPKMRNAFHISAIRSKHTECSGIFTSQDKSQKAVQNSMTQSQPADLALVDDLGPMRSK